MTIHINLKNPRPTFKRTKLPRIITSLFVINSLLVFHTEFEWIWVVLMSGFEVFLTHLAIRVWAAKEKVVQYVFLKGVHIQRFSLFTPHRALKVASTFLDQTRDTFLTVRSVTLRALFGLIEYTETDSTNEVVLRVFVIDDLLELAELFLLCKIVLGEVFSPHLFTVKHVSWGKLLLLDVISGEKETGEFVDFW